MLPDLVVEFETETMYGSGACCQTKEGRNDSGKERPPKLLTIGGKPVFLHY
jgi:hypothetical protein